MKRLTLLALGLVILGSSGCSTKGYVREQVDPLNQRLDKLEACVRSMNQRLGDVEKRSGTTAADLDAVRKDMADTRGQLQQGGAAGQQDPATRADAAAAKAEAAATRAETAADKADRAAEKSSKAFELGQRK